MLRNTISFPEVLDFFDQQHPIRTDNTNEHARGLLIQADKKFGAEWALVSLDSEDVLNIMLPHHISEGGKVGLIPRTGMTVFAAAKKIQDMSIDAYRSANPVCWGKIDYWNGRQLTPVFLSVTPVEHDDYAGFIDYHGHLIHIDGLHRLIAWSLSQSERGERAPAEEGENLLAYVAGPYADYLSSRPTSQHR
ncbi:MAG: DUF6309 family protein [Candidatus Sulfotelmatobacter sp.]